MDRTSWADYSLFALIYFLQGALGLAGIAIPLFMKEDLGLTIPLISFFSGVMALPWVLKPVYGFLSDYVPLFGYRRKSYLFLGALCAVFGWIMTSQVYTLTSFIIAQVFAALGVASLDVFADGLAVEKSTERNRGFIQSVCWGARSCGAIATGFLGGYLLQFFSYREVFLLTAILPCSVALLALTIKEAKGPQRGSFVPNIVALGKTYTQRPELWWVALFLFALFATPSFGTPLFFYLKKEVGLSETFLGFLASLSSIGGVLAALFYASLSRRYSLHSLLFYLVLLNFSMTFTYLFIMGNDTALIVYFSNGFVGYVTLIACMTLIAKVCPNGSEATTFALITGIVNFAGSVVSPIFGGWLFTFMNLSTLIMFSALSNIVALIILHIMPQKISLRLPKIQ